MPRDIASGDQSKASCCQYDDAIGPCSTSWPPPSDDSAACQSDSQSSAHNPDQDETSPAFGGSSLEWLNRGSFQIGFSFWGAGAPTPLGFMS